MGRGKEPMYELEIDRAIGGEEVAIETTWAKAKDVRKELLKAIIVRTAEPLEIVTRKHASDEGKCLLVVKKYNG